MHSESRKQRGIVEWEQIKAYLHDLIALEVAKPKGHVDNVEVDIHVFIEWNIDYFYPIPEVGTTLSICHMLYPDFSSDSFSTS